MLIVKSMLLVKDTGSNKDFGVTNDSRLYFDLSTPGRYYGDSNSTEPSFANPKREPQLSGKH